MFVKLQQHYFCSKKRDTVVNLINILRAHFSYKSKLSSFSLITFGFAISWCQNSGKKVACKMLMKLTHGGLYFQNTGILGHIEKDLTHDLLIGIKNTFLTTTVHESCTVLKNTDNRSQFTKWSSFLGEVTNTMFDESNWNQR